MMTTILYEHAQSKGGVFPQYKLLQAIGECHCPSFTMEVTFGERTAEGMATNKKQAKHEAAKNMLAIVRGEEEASNSKQNVMEDDTNQEHDVNESKAKTDDKRTLGQEVYTGNKIGELQEFCMSRGFGVPAYKDGETTGPSHKRYFTIVCVIGSLQRVGEGEQRRRPRDKLLELYWRGFHLQQILKVMVKLKPKTKLKRLLTTMRLM